MWWGEQVTMERTLFTIIVVLLSSAGCLGQESTQSQPQSSTTGAATVNWDTTAPPTSSVATPSTASVTNAQTENTSPPRANQDYATIFPNLWGPMLMPMNVPAYGDRLYNRKTRYEVKDVFDFNPFFRRPDAYYPTNLNNTVVPENVRYPTLPSYQSFPPPGVFYPQQFDRGTRNFRYPNQIDLETRTAPHLDESQTQPGPIPSPPSPGYRPPIPNPYGNAQFFGYPPLDYYWRNRDRDNAVPSKYQPGFYPPGGSMYPQVNVFVRPPYGDDDSGPVASENVAERRQTLPENPVASSNSLPASTPVPVPPNLPMLPNPYFYGYPPLRFQPPFSPSLLPRPAPVIPNIRPPASNLVDVLVPDPVPAPDVDVSVSNLPPVPPKTVPEIVNVEVLEDPETSKPVDGRTGPNIPYRFGYDMTDGLGTGQHREESADEDGVVTGSYGYNDYNGVYRVVNYVADKDGFRAYVKTNEPGAANPGSANVVVFAESPPVQVVAEGLRRADIDVAVSDDQVSEMEVESVEKK